MGEIKLSAGTIEYEDTGGDGPALVLLGGLLMDASLWEEVIGELSAEYRCVAPTLPMRAHRHAMQADADLSPRGLARLVAELLERLDLDDVTLVGNDTGGGSSCSPARAPAGWAGSWSSHATPSIRRSKAIARSHGRLVAAVLFGSPRGEPG